MNRGEVFLAPFPYADLQGSKRRPVCVVSTSEYNQAADPLVAMVTSSRTRLTSPGVGDVVVSFWKNAGLLQPSVARVGKLFAIETRLLTGPLGSLDASDRAAVDQALKLVLGLP